MPCNFKSRSFGFIFLVLTLFGIIFVAYFDVTFEVVSNIGIHMNITGYYKNFGSKFYQDKIHVNNQSIIKPEKQLEENLLQSKEKYFNQTTAAYFTTSSGGQIVSKNQLIRTTKATTTKTMTESKQSNKKIQVQNINTNCSLWEIPTNHRSIKPPLIKLDPKRFLYPGLKYGPNNQITGFKEAIYLAIRLNRTIVVPKFQSHYTNRGRRLSPFQMIDVERLCSFVSCISVEDLKMECNGSFDVVFKVGGRLTKYYSLLYQNQTQMTIFHHNQNFSEISFLPFLAKIDLNKEFSSTNSNQTAIKYNMKSVDFIRKAFRSSASCAIVISLFRNLPVLTDIAAMSYFNLSVIDNFVNASDEDLLYGITNAVKHPPCIVQAASDYIRDVLNGSMFIGIHWRFDKRDWIMHCRGKTNEKVKLICENVMNMEPAYVVEKLKMFYKNQSIPIKNVPIYMAAPPNANDFRDQFLDELSNSSGLFVKPKVSLESYLSNRFQPCWKQNAWIHSVADIVSLCEMELMIQSTWFLFSFPSTWSNIARMIRKTMKHNDKHLMLEEKVADIFLNTPLTTDKKT